VLDAENSPFAVVPNNPEKAAGTIGTPVSSLSTLRQCRVTVDTGHFGIWPRVEDFFIFSTMMGAVLHKFNPKFAAKIDRL
jgi:hypothetical protein